MDYQFINTIKGETYVNLDSDSKGREFPPQAIGDVKKYGSLDYFLKTDINEVLTYFKLNRPGNPPIEVLSKAARKMNSVSVGRFTQCFGWQWESQPPKDAPIDRFEKILNTRFYTENEIDALADSREISEISEQPTGTTPRIELNVKPEAIKAVFYGAMLCWLRGDSAVQIAVPSGVDYTAYVIAAVKKIYSYFPIGLRTEAGFCSYLPKEKAKELPAIFIGFIPESMKDSQTVFLDGSSVPAINELIKGTGLGNLDLFINHICKLEDADRPAFIGKVYADSEDSGAAIASNNITAIKYTYLGDAIRLLEDIQNGNRDIQQWKLFYSAFDKYPPSMRKDIDDAIHKELSLETLRNSVEGDCEDASTAEDVAAVMKGYDALCGKENSWSDTAWDVMYKLLGTRIHLDSAGMLDFAKNYRKDLGNIISKERVKKIEAHVELVMLRERYVKIRSIDLTKLMQARQALTDAQNLHAEAVQVYETYGVEEAEQFKRETEELVKEIEEKKTAAENSAGEIIAQLEAAGDYFAALDKYAELKARISAMDDDGKGEVARKLTALRGNDCGKYIEELKNYCGIADGEYISLKHIARCPEDQRVVIVKDLAEIIKDYPLKFGEEAKAREISNKIYFAQEFIKRISPDCKLKVEYYGEKADAERLKKLAECSLTARDVPDNKDKYRNLLLKLADSKVYDINCFSAVFYMAKVCGFSKYERRLFYTLLEGKFTQASDEDYFAAFDCLCRYVNAKDGKTPLERLEKWKSEYDDWKSEHPESNRSQLNPNAARCFEDYIYERSRPKENQREQPVPKQSPVLVVALGAIALLLLATSVILFVKYKKDTDQLRYESEQNIMQLQQQIADSYAVSLFDKEFDEYVSNFEKAWNKGDNAGIIDTYCDEHNIEDVIYTHGDQQVKWGEYVFWTLALASNDYGNVTDEAINNAQLKINSAIALMHPAMLPEQTPAPTPETTVSEDGAVAPDSENPDDVPTDAQVNENEAGSASAEHPEGNSADPAQTEPSAQDENSAAEQTDAEATGSSEDTAAVASSPETEQDQRIIEMVRVLFENAKASLDKAVN